MKKVCCDYCGNENYQVLYEIDTSEESLRYYRYARNIPEKEKMIGIQSIVKCAECDLIYTNPRFTTQELNLVYSSDDVIGGNWQQFWYLFKSNLPDVFKKSEIKFKYNPKFYQWKFDIIESNLDSSKKSLKLLDIGCGDGRFVHDALQRGYDAYGIDLSPDRIEKGKEIYGLPDNRLKCKNVDEFSSDEKFDIIVLWDVIEHVESPSELLQHLKNISHSKSKIFLLTMSVDSITYKLFKRKWNYINPTQHLHYFSHSTMKNVLNKNGFELISVEMDDSKDKNFLYLLIRIVVGQINQFFFNLYTKNSWLAILFKPFQGNISHERMLKRIENLYPGSYVGRYHDNFVFVGSLMN